MRLTATAILACACSSSTLPPEDGDAGQDALNPVEDAGKGSDPSMDVVVAADGPDAMHVVDSSTLTCAAPATNSGGLTQYDQTSANNCAVPWPSDNLYAAISTPDYDSPTPSGACGKCLLVTGPTGMTATFLAVDQCPTSTNPKCVKGHLDLSHTAYAAVVPSNYPGEILNSMPVSWHFVPCAVTGNITYHFDSGSSSYWVGVQVRNARYGIKMIRYRSGMTWVDMTDRTDALAYFTANLSNQSTIDLQAVDEHDHVLEDDGVAIGSNVDRAGNAQFPLCP